MICCEIQDNLVPSNGGPLYFDNLRVYTFPDLAVLDILLKRT